MNHMLLRAQMCIRDRYMSVLSSLSVDEKLDLIAKLTNSIRNAHTKERNIEMEDPFACLLYTSRCV